jgi:trk system potassium uptake protein TrkH
LAYLFETVSAFGTVGLSVGVTPMLSPIQKTGLIAMMFIGRVGVLTLAYLLTGGGTCKGVEHAEENMMIG